MSDLLLALPGQRAERRLRQILKQQAAEAQLSLRLPEIVTPAEIPERLYTLDCPLAAPTDRDCAWMRAVGRLSPDDLTRLRPPGPGSALGFSEAGIASLAARARAEVMAEGLSFADAARRCAALPGFCDDSRWEVLARLEAFYQAELAQAGLCDRDDARRQALWAGAIQTHATVILLATVDLGGLTQSLLRALRTPVIALLPAPPEMQDGFDDVGGLVADFWRSQPLRIAEDYLHFPAHPTAEAQAIARLAANAGGPITLGVGNESDAPSLARRLRACGIRTQSPFGPLATRTRPGLLLQGLRDWATDPSARNFAALLRHPDLEAWISTQRVTEQGEESNTGESLLTTLDDYRSRRLPERLPPTTLPAPLQAARQALETLCAPYAGRRALPAWAEPLRALLQTVFEEPCSGEDAESRALAHALQRFSAALDSLEATHPSLAPTLSGPEAMTFLLGRVSRLRLPDDAYPEGTEMMGWLELALDDAPCLLLTGLHEGAVPAASLADPLLPETLRRHLGLPDARGRAERDSFFLRVILESRAQIHLFAARRGPGGEPLRPSRLLFQCDGATAARRALRFAEGDGATQTDAEGDRPLFTPGTMRRLPPPRPESLASPVTSLVVTAFRDYLACPYRFYLKHVCQLKERADDAEELDAARFGELLHRCLATFAHCSEAQSSDVGRVRDALRANLKQQVRTQFGEDCSPAIRLQARQVARRLDAFAHWQADHSAAGWIIQPHLAEQELQAPLLVDKQPFWITGRLDRVDYHPGQDRYRIVDYKTGDTAVEPDRKHRGPADKTGQRAWLDLQLPLYCRLAASHGIKANQMELGYVALPAEAQGCGFLPAPWTAEELAEADACAERVIRAIRAEVFWPPAAPSRYPDAFSGLCLDHSRDRDAWFPAQTEGEAR